ncbi:carbohydrate porin, partial [bacterium]|nr:carbohydrate porin [bacterium]
YDFQLGLSTSFTGKDQLTAVLRGGNFDSDRNVFGSGGPSGLATLETAFQKGDRPNLVAIDKLFYSFPLGDEIAITIGTIVGQEDMLAIWPSVYPSDPILDVLTVNGAPASYNKIKGAGVGISLAAESGARAAANYVASNGASSDTRTGGFATDKSGGTGTLQLGWEGDNWGLAALFSKVQNGQDLIAFASPFVKDHFSDRGVTNAYALGGFWQPLESGWLPSVSLGLGINQSDTQRKGQVNNSQSWRVGLEWNDVFIVGNNAGMAVGQPVIATDLRGGDNPADGQFIWEWWYQFQVTDSNSVTPALFYLSRPMGELTPEGSTFQQLGGLIKTTFVF